MFNRIVIILLSITICYLLFVNTNKEPIVVDQTATIDSLQCIVDSLVVKQNEFNNKKDSIKLEIIEIEKAYETKYTDIINQSVASDIKFFSDYISKNN